MAGRKPLPRNFKNKLSLTTAIAGRDYVGNYPRLQDGYKNN